MIPCTQCNAENPDGSKFCGACGVPLEKPLLAQENKEDVLQNLSDRRHIAPEFLSKWRKLGSEAVNFAKSWSDEHEDKINLACTPEQLERGRDCIRQYLDVLEEKQYEFAEMMHQVHRVYDRIHPSIDYGFGEITRKRINEERSMALEMIDQFSKEIDAQVFHWEVILFRLGGKRNKRRVKKTASR